jgi:hypothetical protein
VSGTSKPIGRWRSRKEAVLTLHDTGLSAAEITREPGISANTVRRSLQQAGRSTRANLRVPQAHGLKLTPGLTAALAPIARKRSEPAHVLAWRILDAAVTGDLIDAILDDGGER